MKREEYLEMVKKDKEDLGINPDLQDEEIYACMECGSLDVEERYWVNMNNGQITDSAEDGECFCNSCGGKRPYINLITYLYHKLYEGENDGDSTEQN